MAGSTLDLAMALRASRAAGAGRYHEPGGEPASELLQPLAQSELNAPRGARQRLYWGGGKWKSLEI